MLRQLRKFYEYLHWANDRAISAARELSTEEYTRDFGISFKSVHGTLSHMLGAEWIWLERWQGRSPTALPGGANWTTLAEVEAAWQPVRAGQLSYLDGITDADLDARLEYRNIAGQTKSYGRGDILLHVVNHATLHRGQLVSLLRQLGRTPPQTDYSFFLDAPKS
jgi:uncharacterized damage-inducible protein DinB